MIDCSAARHAPAGKARALTWRLALWSAKGADRRLGRVDGCVCGERRWLPDLWANLWGM